MCRAHPCMCSSCHTCCLLGQVLSCWSTHKCFPAGCCGSFFRGQEETTLAMPRQNQFVAVFYSEEYQSHKSAYFPWGPEEGSSICLKLISSHLYFSLKPDVCCLFSPFGSNPQLSFIPIPYFLTSALSSSLPLSHSAFHVFFCVAAVFCYSIFLLLGSPCCWIFLWISLSMELCFPHPHHQKLSAPHQLLVSSFPVPSCPSIHPCWTWPMVAPPAVPTSLLEVCVIFQPKVPFAINALEENTHPTNSAASNLCILSSLRH